MDIHLLQFIKNFNLVVFNKFFFETIGIVPKYLNNFIFYYCGAQMIYGPGPSTQGESKGPSRGGLWPKFDKIAFGYRRG